MWLWTLLGVALAAPVTFEVNHAFVKGQAVPEASIEASETPDGDRTDLGVTDAAGHLTADLEPGTWYVRTSAPGFVPLPPAPVEIPAEGRLVTTTLTPLLEATGDAERQRVQIVLNWGSDWSDVPDADSHLVCAADGFEVYFADKEHEAGDHRVELDVDDVDWGGPETITLWDVPAGDYRYFVRNYSGATYHLGTSDVVVRVLAGDQVIGTWPVPADVESQDWYPFHHLAIDGTGGVRAVPFTDAELAEGLDRQSSTLYDVGCGGVTSCLFVALVLPGFGLLVFLFRTFLRRR